MTDQDIRLGLRIAFDLRAADLPRSVETTLHLLEQSRALGHEELAAQAMNHLGLYYVIRGDFDQARTYTESALQYFEKQQDIRGIADARYNLGSIDYRTNRHPQALVELRDCLKMYRQLGDDYNQARTLKSMGTVYELFGDFGRAMQSYTDSMACARKANDEALESNVLSPLSTLYYKQGDRALAAETIEHSIRLKRKTNDRRGLAFALYGRGKIFMREGRYEEALTDFAECRELQKSAGDNLGLAMVLNKIGETFMLRGDLEEAERRLQEAWDHANRYALEIITFRVHFNFYQLRKRQGDDAAALEHLEKHWVTKETFFSKENYNLIQSYEAVTQMERLEQEASRQREKTEIIERKNAELDSFFYRVSHDLKGPISSMLGLHALAQKEVKDPQALQYFDMTHSQIRRINDIVMGLINLTRIGNSEEQRVLIDFDKLIEDCVESCRYLPHFEKVSVRKKTGNMAFHSEWAILNTILQNLIDNAIKYCRPDNQPYVEIRVFSDTQVLTIEVEDNGQGISDEHQKNVFDMFFRSSNRLQGSGLGLYILKRAVERLQGKISLKSTIGRGSTFIITLPVELPATNIR